MLKKRPMKFVSMILPFIAQTAKSEGEYVACEISYAINDVKEVPLPKGSVIPTLASSLQATYYGANDLVY